MAASAAQPPIMCPKKRKTVADYFNSTSKRQNLSSQFPSQASPPNPSTPFSHTILPSQSPPVPGLGLLPAVVSSAEESSILSFLNDPSKCTWRTDLSRRTMHFGGTYCLMPPKQALDTTALKPKVLQAPPMPPELNWLLDRMIDQGIFPPSKRPQYCIVNEYTGTQGISAHTENFSFGEPVVGLSLLSTGSIRFHELTKPFDGSVRSGEAGKAEKTRRRVDLEMPGRSLLVMKGESRWRWQHEIVRSAKGRGIGWKRVSLTFRWKEGG